MTAPLFDDLPEWIDRDAWEAFVEVRLDKKKAARAPFTPRARQRMLKRLEEMRQAGHTPAAINAQIDESARNGWSDIYAPRAQPAPVNGQPNRWTAEKAAAVDAWTGGRASAKSATPSTDIVDMEPKP